MKHPNDMTREELRELVGDMAGMALDLAQYLRFTTEALREDLRPAAYKKAIKMAYELAFYPYNGKRMERGNCEIVVFDEDGLSIHG